MADLFADGLFADGLFADGLFYEGASGTAAAPPESSLVIAGVKVGDAGQVFVTSDSVAASFVLAGQALAADGTLFVIDLGSSAVPAGAVRIAGRAYSPVGALYVTSDAPGTSSKALGGLAVRHDGALHINTGALSGAFYRAGFAATARGALFATTGEAAITWNQVLEDDCNDTDSTNLQSHTADTGGSYVRQSGTASHNIIIFTNRLTKNLSGTPGTLAYYNDLTISEDQRNDATFSKVNTDTGDGRPTITARQQTDANTHYGLRYINTLQRWELICRIAGTAETLATYDAAFVNGNSVLASIRAVTEGDDVRVQGWLDGVKRLEKLCTSSSGSGGASQVISGGHPGWAFVYNASDGIRMDDLAGYEAA